MIRRWLSFVSYVNSSAAANRNLHIGLLCFESEPSSLFHGTSPCLHGKKTRNQIILTVLPCKGQLNCKTPASMCYRCLIVEKAKAVDWTLHEHQTDEEAVNQSISSRPALINAVRWEKYENDIDATNASQNGQCEWGNHHSITISAGFVCVRKTRLLCKYLRNTFRTYRSRFSSARSNSKKDKLMIRLSESSMLRFCKKGGASAGIFVGEGKRSDH